MTYSLQHAVALHRSLPPEGWLALREAGLSDPVIHSRLLGWDGDRITIPVFSLDRQIVAIERADFDEDGVLFVEPDEQAPVHLFGAPIFHTAPSSLMITEGVADALVLQSQRFNVVSGTGSGRSLPDDVLDLFRGPREVFVCFGRGRASDAAVEKVVDGVPEALRVRLPVPVGQGLGHFFVRLHRTREDFLRLLAEAS